MARKRASDPAHTATDKEIERIEKEIAKEYKQAHEEVTRKTEEYFKDFRRKDEEWRRLVKDGKVTEKQYIAWRKGQILVGKRWEELYNTIAEDYLHAAEIAMSICKEHAPLVYAVNHDYTTFEIEKGTGLDTSYTLYSRETIERMYREDPKLYHDYGKTVAKEIREGKQVAWDRKRVKSVLTQAVLQGESIPKIVKRLEIVTGGDHKAAIRNARTMMTGIQNAGRIDAMKRAEDLGIPTKKQWMATVDNRTRHWHRQLDGVIKELDEPFENEMGKIMFPADPEASGANVYNCRCTLLTAIKGFELNVTDPSVRPMPELGDMSYEEWKSGKKQTIIPTSEKKQVPSPTPSAPRKEAVPDSLEGIDAKIAEWQEVLDKSDDFNDWVKAEEEIQKLKDRRPVLERQAVDTQKNEIKDRMISKGFFDDGKAYIGQYDFTDVSVDNLLEIEKAYDRVFDRYPQLKGKLVGISKWDVVTDVDAMASTDFYGGAIKFNPQYWGSNAIRETMKDLYKGSLLATDTPEGAVVHEIGHGLDSFLKNRWEDPRNFEAMYRKGVKSTSVNGRFMDKVYKEAGIDRTEVERYVSKYATYSDEEAFAECFAAYITGSKDNEVIRAFGKLFEKLMVEVK